MAVAIWVEIGRVDVADDLEASAPALVDASVEAGRDHEDRFHLALLEGGLGARHDPGTSARTHRLRWRCLRGWLEVLGESLVTIPSSGSNSESVPKADPKTTLKMSARTSGARKAMIKNRSVSDPQPQVLGGDGEDPAHSSRQGLSGQMKEDRLQIGLFDLDSGDIEAGAGGGAEDGSQTGSGILDQQDDAVLVGGRFRHAVGSGQDPHHFEDGPVASDRDPVLLPDHQHQLPPGAFGHDLALIDDPHPVAQALGFFHVVGRVEDGHALGGELLDRLEDRVAGLGIDPDRRLVEDEELGAVKEADGDVEPALHASREFLGDVGCPIRQADHFEHLGDPALEGVSGHPVETAEERHVLGRRQVGVDGQVLGHQPDVGLGSNGSGGHHLTVDPHLSPVELEQPGDHRNRGGLAGAVGTQQPVSLTRSDVKGGAVDRLQIAEALLEPLCFQYVHRFSLLTRLIRSCMAFKWSASALRPCRVDRARVRGRLPWKSFSITTSPASSSTCKCRLRLPSVRSRISFR